MNYLIMIFMSLLMGSANAADLFTPVANDISVKLLNAIFPGLVGQGGADAVASAMGIFNGCILMVGGILAAYTVLAGTLGTAHDGEMLGKKFSSIWIPIRYSLGTALVLPVIGGGYNIMQQIVMWIVMQSVGLADNVWTNFVSSQNITNIASVSIQAPDAKQLAFNTLNIEVCMAALAKKQAEKASGSGDAVAIGDIQTGITKEDNLTDKTYYFGDKNETTGLKKDTCGSVVFTKFTMPVQTANGFTNFITSFGNAQKIIDAQESQYAGLVASLTPLAVKIYETKKAIDPALVIKAANDYQANVSKNAASIISSSDAFSDLSKNASQDGWGAAGFWFVKLSNLMDLVQRSLAAVPTANGPTPGTANALEDYANVFPAVMDTMNKGGANITGLGIGNEQGGSNTSWWENIKETVRNLDPSIMVKKAFTTGMNFAIQDNEHPLMAMKRLGNTTLGIAGAGFGTCMLLLNTVGNAPGVGMAIASAMFMAVIPLGIVGVLLSYVLPMMPALIWIGVLVGWFIQIIEAVIAASLWAILHLHPNGDDMAGGGANGYKLILGIIFRPVLSVFGLIAALLSLQIFGQFINKIFADAFLVSQQDSGLFIWLVGLIVAPLMYCAFMYTIVKKLFEIVHVIPDQLMQWAGGGHSNVGDYAKTMGGGADHSTAITQVAGQINQQGQNMIDNIKNGKANNGTDAKPFSLPIGADGKEISLSDAQSQVLNTVAGANPGKSQSDLLNKSTFNKMQGAFNAVNPKMGDQFKESLADVATSPANKDLSATEMMSKAFNGVIRQNYGQGAVSAMNNFAKGDPAKFQEALSQFENARQGASADLGSHGSKQALMQASSAINSAFQANANKPESEQVSAQEIFNTHLSRFNDSSEIATPKAETPSVESPAVETPSVEPQQVAQTPQISTENQTSDNQFKE